MCYPLGAYWEGDYKSTNHRRQLFTSPATATEEMARRRQVANTGGGVAEGSGGGRVAEGGGGGGGIIKVCLCSPTSHPGSFRCRHHHGEYQWVKRLGPKTS